MKKPVLAITMGDPCGVGPEVVLKSLTSKKIYEVCRPLVIGDAQVFSLLRLGTALKIRPILNPAQAQCRRGTIDVLHVPCSDFSQIVMGRPNAVSGRISALAVRKSIECALMGLVDGVVHAPISKLAWNWAGVRYPGHTEMIARLCGVQKVAMAIASEPLRTVLVTRHIPFHKVASALNVNVVMDTILLAESWMRQIKIPNPRIGICALNPHGGENGLIGNEEIRVLAPAIQKARKKARARLSGPHAADSVFRDHKNGLYDCLITLYHDQSLIPLKLFSASRLVNITLGLPFPRTSPGHGTAFDIAGKGLADECPMTQAILTAARN
ncbi:MAG: 4-hydroxythreonine-4-phosphate dehydrogenase PdxA [Elusimicrobia bacterium]|nr:4-hydroxythreonine-4-phosphate dehydrogenase PdxA [Elusimicrobiota bacterium]